MLSISQFIKRNNIKGLSFFKALIIKHTKNQKIRRVPFFNGILTYNDGPAFLHSAKEIFVDEIYKINLDTDKPFIIDCGCNIGMSILYFKSIYPDATILGFEPDPEIYQKVLLENIKSYNLSNVEVRNTGLWDMNTVLTFHQEGTMSSSFEAGTAANTREIKIKVEKLSAFINRKVDFLKIDIEGAEWRVLSEISSLLNNVKKIFIEYHSIANSQQNLSNILQVLTSAGYRYYIKQANDIVKFPLLDSSKILEGYDLQLNIFGMRE